MNSPFVALRVTQRRSVFLTVIFLLLSHCSSGSGSSILSGILTGDTGTDSTTSPSSTEAETTNSATVEDSSESDYSDSSDSSGIEESQEQESDIGGTPTDAGANEEQAMMPPPSLQNLTVATYSSMAVVQTGGFDEELNGQYLVITHNASESTATASHFLLGDWLVPAARAEESQNICDTADVLCVPIDYCADCTEGDASTKLIENFQAGDNLSFQFFNPETGEVSETLLVEDPTPSLIYVDQVPESPWAMTGNSVAVFQTGTSGNLAVMTLSSQGIFEHDGDLFTSSTLNLHALPLNSGLYHTEAESWIRSSHSELYFAGTYLAVQLAVSSEDMAFLLLNGGNETLSAAVAFDQSDIGGTSIGESTEACFSPNCIPQRIKVAGSHFFYSAKLPAAQLGSYEAAAIFQLTESTEENPIRATFLDATVNSFSNSLAFDIYSEGSINNFFTLFLDDSDPYGDGDQLWMNFTFHNKADPTQNVAINLRSDDLQQTLATDQSRVLDMVLIEPITTLGDTAQLAIFTTHGIYFQAISYDGTNWSMTTEVALTSATHSEFSKLITVTANTNKSQAFVVINEELNTSADDAIIVIDLANKRIDTSYGEDGVISLADVLGGYRGDINPRAAQYFASQTGDEYLLVSSQELRGILTVVLDRNE